MASRRAVLGAAVVMPLALPGLFAGEALAAGRLLTAWHERQRGLRLKFLAPLKASADRLMAARRLAAADTREGYEEALRLVRAAGVNCYMYADGADDVTTVAQRVSQLQGNVGTEVCTFSIVLNNIAVRDEDEPQKDQAFDRLSDLKMAYMALDEVLVKARTQGDGSVTQDALASAFDVAVRSNEALQDAIVGLLDVDWN